MMKWFDKLKIISRFKCAWLIWKERIWFTQICFRKKFNIKGVNFWPQNVSKSGLKWEFKKSDNFSKVWTTKVIRFLWTTKVVRFWKIVKFPFLKLPKALCVYCFYKSRNCLNCFWWLPFAILHPSLILIFWQSLWYLTNLVVQQNGVWTQSKKWRDIVGVIGCS